MEEEETNGSKSNGGGGQCAVATFVFSWVLLILNTALSLACKWAYSQQTFCGSSNFDFVELLVGPVAVAQVEARQRWE